MANQKIGVTLDFQARTKSAEQQIKNLQTALDKVMLTTSRTSGQMALTKELTEASAAAAQLKTHIASAMNTNTGKLDLSKFNQSLKQSGMNISQYRQALSQAGAAGQQAFNQLAISITTAEVPLVRISSGLRKLGTTLANTARWQISSSLLMGFTSAISTAYNYAQDLNESLNNIRIVTGYSIEQMDKFATSATKAAKALSTTTTKYTDASLIYFQQGLSDEEVKKRTNLTIKMANVTGDSVSAVSDQLTAVWNNFDNGTKSLEHYVDVMVALGAATASSSQEISEGLNKFAAVAETVGLSYEYAAAALTTVTATTRESADVVGTAFKTLFARIQDLELGKTLDDGTTLGQYSQALASVGISIKDANGQVKNMNSILDEMGAKWDSLNKAQQIALAQNVAGVRQYTQLIALMDNWDYFQENLTTANTSAGALTEQADIYAESWQAARNRVTASLEDIYNKLLEDDAFIEILNFFDKFLKQVSNTIDSLGGLQGVLTTVGTVLLNVFSQQIAQSMTNLSFSIKTLTKSGRQELLQLQQDAAKEMAASYGTTGLSALQGQAAASMSTAQQEYARQAATMNDTQKEIAQHILSQQQGLAEAAMNQAEYTKEAEKTARVLANVARADMRQSGKDGDINAFNDKIKLSQAYGAANTVFSGLQKFDEGIEAFDVMKDASAIVQDLQSHLTGLGITSKELPSSMSQSIKGINGAKDAFKKYAAAAEAADNALKTGSEEEKIAAVQALIDAERNLNAVIDSGVVVTNGMSKAQREAIAAARSAGEAYGKTAIKAAEAAVNVERLPEAMRKATTQTRELSQDIVAFAQGLGSVAMAYNSVKGIIDVLNNEDMTFWEKLLSITTSLSMAIPMLITGMKALSGIELTNTIGKIANAAATWEQVRAENALQKETGESIVKKGKQTLIDGVNTTGKKANSIKDIWNKNALKGTSTATKNAYRQQIMSNEGWTQVYGQRGQGIVGYKNAQGVQMSSKEFSSYLTQQQGKMAGKAALKGASAKLLAGAATAAVVVASIAAAKAIYDAADEAYNRDEYAAQRAEKAASNLASAYDKAASSYAEFDSAAEAHLNTLQSLEELTKGTLEYEQGIAKANEEALKLINTYDELAGQYHTTAEGLIVFNEGALENIRILELQKKNAAAVASTIAQQNAREARIQADKTKYLREKIRSNEAQELTTEDKATTAKDGAIGLGAGAVAGVALAGTKLGAAAGSWAGPIGAAIGAVAGAVLGVTVGAVTAAIDKKEATEKESEAIDTLAKAYAKMGDQALTKDNMAKLLGEDKNSKLIASLDANREELTKLMQAIKADTEARIAENTNLARQLFAGKDEGFVYLETSVQSAISTVAGTIMTRREDEIDRERKDYTKGRWYTLGIARSTEEGREQFNKYLEDQGINMTGKARFSRDGIKYSYIGENNEKIDAVLDYETLETWQEGQEIAQEIEQSYDNIRKSVLELYELGGEGLASVLSGQDVNQLTKQQIEDLKKAYESGELDEELQELGELSGENYSQAVADAINNWDYDAALSNYANKTKAEIDSILLTGSKETGVSVQALENYSQVLLKNSGALQTYTDAWDELDYKKRIAEMAVANAKFTKGVQNLSKVYTDNLDILLEWNELSLDTWESVAKVQKALEQTFGLKVSADFIKKNLEQIGELAAGDITHLDELRLAAAQDFILNLEISDEQKMGLETYLLELNNKVQNNSIEFDASIDDSSYIESLNTMLDAGKITKEQVQAIFGSIGYDVDLKTKPKVIDNTTDFAYTNDQTGQSFSGSYTTHQKIEVPYIAGEDTNDPEAGTTSGSGFTYTGRVTGTADLLKNNQQSAQGVKQTERHHYIDRKLKEIEKDYDAIAKARKRAFGVDKVALYDREITKLEEVQSVLQDYVDSAKATYEQNRTALLTSAYGVELDSEGNIKNYEELFAKYGTSNTFKELVSNYEKSLDTWKDKIQEVIDKKNELLDLKLEKIQYEIDLVLKIDDQSQKYFDFLIKMADDPLNDAAEKINLLTQKIDSSKQATDKLGESLREALSKTGWDNNEIDSLLSGNNIEQLLSSNELTEKQIKILEQYRDQLYTTMQMMLTWADDIRDIVIKAFDELGVAFDESTAKLEHYNKVLTSYENIIDLVGKDTLGMSDEALAQLSQAQVDNAIAQLEVSQEAHATNTKALEELRKSYNKEWSEDAKEAWNEAIKHAEEKVRKSEETLFNSWESALQAAAKAFEKAVNTAVTAFEKSMSGLHGSFNAMQTAYSQQKTLGERYVQDYEKIYQLSKLNRAVQNSIDDTDGIKAKKELAKLQEDILALSESDAEVSQYQLDSLQKQYDLKLAEIALEEAQNAKTQVRMQRDSEGNWGYVYTADQDNINSAQQNYEDKLFEFQGLTQKYIEENSDALIQLQQEYADAMANIKRENYATQEKYEEALRQTTQFYESMMDYHLNEIGLATTDANRLYEEDWQKYKNTADQKIGKDIDWIRSWDKTILALTTGYKNVSDYQDGFKENSTKLIFALSQAYSSWEDSVSLAMTAAGTSMDKFAKQVEKDTSNIQSDTVKITNSLQTIGREALSAYEGVVSAAKTQFTAYSQWVASYIAKNSKLIASLNEVIRKKAEAAGATNVTTSGGVDDITGDLGGEGNGATTPSAFVTDTSRWTISADQMERDGVNVAKKTSLSLTKEELANLTRSSDYGAYYVVKNGVKYELDDDQVRHAMAQAGLDTYQEKKEYQREITSSSEPNTDTDPPFEIGDKVSSKSGKKLLPYDGTEEIGYQQWIAQKQSVENATIQDIKIAEDGTRYYYTGQGYNGIGVYDLGIKFRKSYYKESDLMKAYDTGGYTGEWDSSGRLAMLHQKEIVLNAHDTENFLAAINIVRDIASAIDLRAAAQQSALSQITAASVSPTMQTLEQEVTIHAEFPNATQRTEIEAAFDTLLNRASQFANRKV